jgi:hypothetical protein
MQFYRDLLVLRELAKIHTRKLPSFFGTITTLAAYEDSHWRSNSGSNCEFQQTRGFCEEPFKEETVVLKHQSGLV